jgi:hypothetical protein
MYSFLPLWLPVLVSAVAVFIVSSIIHMVIRWHQHDEGAVPNEDAVADLLRGLPAGEYRLPWAANMEDMKAPAFQEKVKRGPMARIGIWQGDMTTGFKRSLILWFAYSLVASFIAGHVALAALGRETDAHDIFHAVVLTAFAGYGLGLAQQSIWGPKKWWPTVKGMVDAVIYSLVTAGVFVWLWPK